MTSPLEAIDCRRISGRSSVAAFYRTVGYAVDLHPDDRLLVGMLGDRIVAAVRLCTEEGVLVLRGMYVAEDLRGRGLGSRLLRFAASEIGLEDCWCVPFAHLFGFYAQVGFLECGSDETPDFLNERLAAYVRKGLEVTVLRRRAWSAIRC